MRKEILPFITTYHPALQNLKSIFMSKWHLIQEQPLLREIYNEPPIISYKRAKSLGDILVRAKLSRAWVVFGLLTSTSQSTPCWKFEPQVMFQGSLVATLIGQFAPTRFWVGKIGANQVWKVLRPTPYEIWQRTFWKSSCRGGSRIFFRRGCTRLLLYFKTNKPHSFFFNLWVRASVPRVIAGTEICKWVSHSLVVDALRN